ncbi:hypothetical protein ACFL7D_11100, partial [candidate division KSB1 bacterium]
DFINRSPDEQNVYSSIRYPQSEKLLNIREREKAGLNEYKLIDEEKNIYQIPIERAMELIAAESK